MATVTFDAAPDLNHINFGVGQPSMDLLPVDLIKAASEDYFSHAVSAEFNYGPMQGDPRFLDTLAKYLEREYGFPTNSENLLLSGGNSQALDFVCSQYIKPGDTVFVEEPSYFLAFQIFRDHGANLVGIPVDDDGISIEFLESALARIKPTLLYTIPSFHNPGGQTLTGKRRQRLVALAQEHDFLIVADEAYQLLYYDAPPPRALGTYADSGHVLSLGSFSKILAPGMRLGWIQTSPVLVKRLLTSGVLNSGGTFNHISSHIVRHAMELGLLDQHLTRTRKVLGQRVKTMDRALHEYMSDCASWRCPTGGYFFWLQLAAGTDTRNLREKAKRLKTGFQPGSLFSGNGGLENYMRLSFAHYGDDLIREGIQRLSQVIKDQSQ